MTEMSALIGKRLKKKSLTNLRIMYYNSKKNTEIGIESRLVN